MRNRYYYSPSPSVFDAKLLNGKLLMPTLEAIHTPSVDRSLGIFFLTNRGKKISYKETSLRIEKARGQINEERKKNKGTYVRESRMFNVNYREKTRKFI